MEMIGMCKVISNLTIPEMITCAINDFVQQNGTETVMCKAELYDLVGTKYVINYSSFLPQDYCYNRFNKGIDFNRQPHLFEYVEKNKYRVIGQNYPYTGSIVHKEKGIKSEKVIGRWETGIATFYF